MDRERGEEGETVCLCVYERERERERERRVLNRIGKDKKIDKNFLKILLYVHTEFSVMQQIYPSFLYQ